MSGASPSEGDKEALSNIYLNLALVNSIYGNYPQVLQQLHHSLALARSFFGKLHKATATRYISLGNVYYQVGDYTKALEAHTEALNILEELEATSDVKLMHISIYRLLMFDHLWRGE